MVLPVPLTLALLETEGVCTVPESVLVSVAEPELLVETPIMVSPLRDKVLLMLLSVAVVVGAVVMLMVPVEEPEPAVAEYAAQAAAPALCAWIRSDAGQAPRRQTPAEAAMADCVGPHWQAESSKAQPAPVMAALRQEVAHEGCPEKFCATAIAAPTRIMADFMVTDL